MPTFRIICLSPAGSTDPAIAIAASRAGGVGLLDLDLAGDLGTARAAVGRLATKGRGELGVRLGDAEQAWLPALLVDLPAAIGLVVLWDHGGAALEGQVRQVQNSGRQAWVEVTGSEGLARAQAAGADGLILKGEESGGWVGETASFVLLQQAAAATDRPFWLQGGIGLHSAAAAIAGGADGVVLDIQLGLLRESGLPEPLRAALASCDGSETATLETGDGRRYRHYSRPRDPRAAAFAAAWAAQDPAGRRALVRRQGGLDRVESVWAFGQDAALAVPLARRFASVSALVPGLRAAVNEALATAAQLRPLDAGAPLAASHGTAYPIVQGPMTRVSDTAGFAHHVAEAGALPFLALALMRGPEAERLLSETRDRLGQRPWGVGVLGFVPAELRQEQLAVVRRHRPAFVLIAGGRPDQARPLEAEGIHTYLHVPSPGLLRLFLKDGARRFVFEGRECGGHVGPRSSFVLWDSAVEILLEEVSESDAANCHLLFAGGIHDARSAAMVAALTAPLAARGMKIGVLIGTAYLFTPEALEGGAIVAEFQRRAIGCHDTVLVESGPGHAVRCIPNAFTDAAARIRCEMVEAGHSAEEIRNRLEELNIGRMRIASKGLTRNPSYQPGGEAPRLVEVEAPDQWQQGMYMIGQVASLRQGPVAMADLHHDVCVGGTELLQQGQLPATEQPSHAQTAAPSRIAIVGISTLVPGASNLAQFWDNILSKTYAIGEVPPDRWDWKLYFDPDRSARDRIYSRWGGFLEPVPFDPLAFGMPPSSLPSIDPMQLLALNAAHDALADAGYADRPFDRSRTSVILGASGGSGELGNLYALRSGLPQILGERAFRLLELAEGLLPEWTEDSFAGLLPNVASGRIANRFDFGGSNYVVDAACASSLSAVHQAVRELETHASDAVLVGGVDTVQTPFGYLCFSKTQALSPNGRPRTFDAEADGIVISEGVVMLMLKRLEDAERDGDRIYALIQATAASSDGRAKGLTAPRSEGQALALERAYAKAGFCPTTVELFEAHGTGTVVGDRTEALALGSFLEAHGAAKASHAVGSVKSMIGHTKATAGVVGLAKVALALHEKVLPATLGVSTPNPKARFGEGPLYVNAENRPWIHADATPRRAGVSAFGFGGTNFHAVLEEYTGGFLPETSASSTLPAELFLWTAPSREELAERCAALEQALASGAAPRLADLAHTLAHDFEAHWSDAGHHAAAVASNRDELRERLASLRAAFAAGDPSGLGERAWWTPEPLAGDLAFIYPGQGSQLPNMQRELAIHFPELRTAFEAADRIAQPRCGRRLSDLVFPAPGFQDADLQAQMAALTETDVAQPALGAAAVGVLGLLDQLGVSAEVHAGHSYGELVALHAAGVFDADTLIALSQARGRCILEASGDQAGTMAAVFTDADRVADAIAEKPDLWLANRNAPDQTIVSGSRAAVTALVERLNGEGVSARLIPVACGFHSPLVAPARERFAELLAGTPFAAPVGTVYGNATAAPYPSEPEAIRNLLAEHLVSPVRFVEEVEAMHAAGVRSFLEVGPKSVLTKLVGSILRGRPHLAVAVDPPLQTGVAGLFSALGALAAQGHAFRPTRLFARRDVRRLDLSRLVADTAPKPLPETTWLVDGGRARPNRQPARPPRPIPWPEGPPATAAPTTTAAPTATPAAITISTSIPPGADQTMARFQELMTQFLETQRQVMTSYLRGNGNGVTPAAAPIALPAFEAPAVPHTMPSAAEEVMVPSGPEPGLLPSTAPPTAPTPAAKADVKTELLKIVSERTGYPVEMLALDADIEADLGIDSIKRVEIVGVLQRTFPTTGDGASESATEELASIKTLGGVVAWVEKALGERTAAAVSATPASPEQARADKTSSLSAADLTSRLLQIVSERTGYPVEMLALDADIEADLGIDSIKRVEIVGALQKDLGEAVGELAPESMEQLAGARTLQAILDGISDLLTPTRAPRPVTPPEEPPATLPLRRFVPTPAPPPAAARARLLPEGHSLVLTGGGSGWAAAVVEALEDRLAALKLPVAHLSDDDLASEESTAAAIARVAAAQGPVGGILHLKPLDLAAQPEPASLEAWRQRHDQGVKALFRLVKAASASIGEGCLLTACPMGGRWGIGEPRPFIASDAALAGFVKTAHWEWPDLHAKAVDVDPALPAGTVAAWLFDELKGDDTEVQVGFTATERLIFPLSPWEAGDAGQQPLAEGSVVLVTGGARGITAGLLAHLCDRSGLHLILVGRSPEPEAEEDPEIQAQADAAGIKGVLIRRGRERGIPAIEAETRRLLREREIRTNLAQLRSRAASLHYALADVADPTAMKAVIDRALADHGRLDVVLHGAGVIEDRLISQKAADSFDRVFDTKADSGWILRSLLPATVRTVVLFSSVAGAYGNRGQADYAAANEVLNKLAEAADRPDGTRWISVGWGPWGGTGMVGPELEREFRRRGIEPIAPEAGYQLIDTLLAQPERQIAELVAGSWNQPPAADHQAAAAPAPPLLARASKTERSGVIELRRVFDPATDPCLDHHRLDGVPVLPMAMAAELLAEAAQTGWPELELVAVRDLARLQGIRFPNGAVTLVATARALDLPQEVPGVQVAVELVDAAEPTSKAYRAVVELAPRLPDAPPSIHLHGLDPFPKPLEACYSDWLFHGPLFQTITAIEGAGPRGMVARLKTTDPAAMVGSAGSWLLDPGVFDGALQMVLLWTRLHHERTPLPSGFRRFDRYAPFGSGEVICSLETLSETGPILEFRLTFSDASGRVLARVEGQETVASTSLNRLGAKAAANQTEAP